VETNRWNLRTKVFIHLGDLESSIQADRLLTEWALMAGGGLLWLRQALNFCYLMESRSKSSYSAWGGWRKIKLVSKRCGQLYNNLVCLSAEFEGHFIFHMVYGVQTRYLSETANGTIHKRQFDGGLEAWPSGNYSLRGRFEWSLPCILSKPWKVVFFVLASSRTERNHYTVFAVIENVL